MACWTATAIRVDVGVALEGQGGERVHDDRAEADAGELRHADQVVDPRGALDPEGLAPRRVVVEEVALDEPDRSSLELDDERLGGVAAVDGRPVARLERADGGLVGPPRRHVGQRQPPRQEREVGALQRSEGDGQRVGVRGRRRVSGR